MKTFIKINTNGYGEKNALAIAELPIDEVFVYNAEKSSKIQKKHWAFNLAPCDEPEFEKTDYSIGCYLPACYGLGLNRYGYYPHPVCGGIDRVLGLDIGRKQLPSSHDLMRDHFEKLCPLCGFFRHMIMKNNGKKYCNPKGQNKAMSKTWINLYKQYRKNPPRLNLY